MTKQTLTAILVLVALNFGAARIVCAQGNKDAQLSQVKHDVDKLGFDENVEVRLQDGSTVRGRISGVADDRFIITDKQGNPRTIQYASARRVQKDNGSTGSQLALAALGVGAAIGMIALLITVGKKEAR